MVEKNINTDKAPKAIGPYSQAIVANGLLFISGQVPVNPETGKVVEGGIKEQTKQALENIKAILQEAGLSFANVAKTTVYLKNMADFSAMNEVYASYFGQPFPARAAFQVAELPLGVAVEIEAIAAF